MGAPSTPPLDPDDLKARLEREARDAGFVEEAGGRGRDFSAMLPWLGGRGRSDIR